jgi:hypothetical protein
MSNALAIAAVTATLKSLLSKVTDPLPGEPAGGSDELSDAWVSTKPPDKARDPQEGNSQLNLFLFQTLPNAAFRNYPMPGSAAEGESAPPPLAIDLYYLVSAYGRGGDDLLAHHLMGRAMSILHENADLRRVAIRGALPGNDLYRQSEHVRVIQHHLSIEELSKLWTIFQTGYRLTTAYHVSVVLIDSPAPVIAPLPVLQRGPMTPYGTDTGVILDPSLTPPVPTLSAVSAPAHQPSARIGSGTALGDVLTLSGARLSGTVVLAELKHATLSARNLINVPNSQVTDSQITLQLPGAPTDQALWPAGPWSLSLLVDGKPSNPVYFTIAPRIAPASAPASGGDITVIVAVSPAVWPDQRVSLLFDDAEVRAPASTSPGPINTLSFTVKRPAPGAHRVRLRVDGVDSFLVLDYAAPVPSFDPSQRVVV